MQIKQTKLESYFQKNRINQTICNCPGSKPLEIHMGAKVYLKCPYCNLAYSKSITHAQAQEIQNI